MKKTKQNKNVICDKLSAGLSDFRNNLYSFYSHMISWWSLYYVRVATWVQSRFFKDISLIINIAYVWVYTHYHFNKSTDDREQTEFLSCWQIHKIFYSVDDLNKQHVGRCLYPCVIKIKTYPPTNTYPKSLKM